MEVVCFCYIDGRFLIVSLRFKTNIKAVCFELCVFVDVTPQFLAVYQE